MHTQIDYPNSPPPKESKEGGWFSHFPITVEGIQKTGHLLGLQLVEYNYSQGPQTTTLRPSTTTKDLLKIYSKKDFSIEQLLKNLFEYFSKIGIHDYLVNRLYSYDEADLNFYMAELCYLFITRGSEVLEKFLADMSSKSINLYLLIQWSLEAFSVQFQNDYQKQAQNERITKFITIVEQAFREGPQNLDIFQSSLSYEAGKQNREKEIRGKYSKALNTFINNMVNISLTLKKHDSSIRKEKLKFYMKRADKWLQLLREKNPNSDLFQGVFIPFRQEKNQKHISTLVVRIVHDEVTCFNTKMRVPYRVAIETIDVNELKSIKKKASSSNDLDDVGNIGDGPEFSENILEVDQMNMERSSMRASHFDKINKYGRNFSVWACEQETKEMHLFPPIVEQPVCEKKGLLSTLLNTREEQTSIYKFHKIYQKSRSLVPDDLQFKALKRFNRQFRLEQVNLEGERLEAYQVNLRRFNIYFKQKKLGSIRRSSIHTEYNVLNPMREDHHYVNMNLKDTLGKRNRIEMRDLKVIDVLKFFKNIQKWYPKYEKEIHQIYKYLHYDELEEQITSEKASALDMIEPEGDTAQKKITNVTIQRKFPWEDIWEDTMIKIKQKSPYSGFKSHKVRVVIFKGGDDLRQELLAMQLIYKFQSIFQAASLALWLRPYEIIVTSASSGILEFLPNTYSIDGLKKKVLNFTNLYDFYKDYFGKHFNQAQSNFIESLAGYSIVCYLLQFKDRHNGNILVDNTGRLIHIDYGFMFSISPGGINFESAPFKLTKEYVQLMEGKESEQFTRFRNLMFQGFLALQKYVDEIIFLVQIMQQESDLPCFKGFDIEIFRDRFKENLDEKSLQNYVNKLINESLDNWRTKQYDNFQKMTNGICP